MRIITGLLFGFMMFVGFSQDRNSLNIGVFADCQYCDCETAGNRFYRNSLQKLSESINHFNENTKVDFVVNMGDFIDRDIESFIPLNSILQESDKPVINLPGNHDFAVEPENRNKIAGMLGLKEMYHSFVQEDWKFIFTDGNDISFNSDDPEKVDIAKQMTKKLKENGDPNFYEWNGGIGHKQLVWLKNQLEEAKQEQLKVVVFCHYPLLPQGAHTLWNYGEVLAILNNYKCVKLWMNGHNHAGNYAFDEGIHFVTLKGMVETEKENAFAEMVLSDNLIEIRGYGREENRRLKLDEK